MNQNQVSTMKYHEEFEKEIIQSNANSENILYEKMNFIFCQLGLLILVIFYLTQCKRQFHYKELLFLCNFSNRSSNKRIFFGLVSVPNLLRQNLTYQYWVRQLYDRGIDDAAFITKQSNQDILNAKYIYPTEEDNRMHNPQAYQPTDIGMKRVIGAKYFLTKTNCSWYWSLTDDVLLDLDALDLMMKELDNQYNANLDKVVKGHLFRRETHVYPQGGVGYIMSRAAAETFVDIGPEWV